jgi:hypothetical protein
MTRLTVLASTAALLAASALARPDFPDRIPNGRASQDAGSGLTCEPLGHEGCVAGAARNQFGLDFKDVGNFKWTKELCEMDSDGDGVTNGYVNFGPIMARGQPCALRRPLTPADVDRPVCVNL